MMRRQLLIHASMPPMDFAMFWIEPSERSWAPWLRLLYICRGTAELWVQGAVLHLEENQVYALQPMAVARVVQGNAVVAEFSFEEAFIRQQHVSLRNLPVQLTSEHTPEEDLQLRNLLAQMIRCSTGENAQTDPLIHQANACHLIAHLLNCYNNQPDAAASNQMDGLQQALDYIKEHAMEPLSVKQAAQVAGFSVSYFSKLFSQSLQCTFTEYLTELRLQQAHQLLMETALSVKQIAENCGFPDARAFSRAYRIAYGRLPTAARAEPPKAGLPKGEGNLAMLGACLDALSGNGQRSIRTEHRLYPDVFVRSEAKPFHHAWQQSIGTGCCSALLQADVQETLRGFQQHGPFRRAVFHGMLDDDMQVCSRNHAGDLLISFNNVDTVLDFLLSIQLEPLIQLGFMPSVLAASREIRLYNGRSIISLPKSMDEWCRLVRSLLLHLFERYGRTRVEGWEVCLWSKPDNPALPFGKMDFDDFFAFYQRTRETVKACSPVIRFGSPAFTTDAYGWLERFYNACREHNCMPDVHRFDIYPVDVSTGLYPAISEYNQTRYLKDPSAFQQLLAKAQQALRDYARVDMRPVVEEWNLSVSQRELLNDTSFKAAYIVKTVLENWQSTPDMSYWAFYDNLGEVHPTDRLFQGGLGLFAKGGLRKPACYAFWMLAQLGDQVLMQQDGYIVTKSRDGYQILLYNYCHFSSLYAEGECFDMSYTNRYTAFVNQHKLHCEITLKDLPQKTYQITTRLLNRRHGSVFDQWVKMGAVSIVQQEEMEYLQGVGQPQMRKRFEQAATGALTFVANMEPFEVRLIQLGEVIA